MTRDDRWLATRVPPPGGLDRLARALEPRAHMPRRWLPVASVAMVGSLCIAAAIGVHLHDAPRHAFEQALQTALDDAERDDARREAARPQPRELPSSRADVRILLIVPRQVSATAD